MISTNSLNEKLIIEMCESRVGYSDVMVITLSCCGKGGVMRAKYSIKMGDFNKCYYLYNYYNTVIKDRVSNSIMIYDIVGVLLTWDNVHLLEYTSNGVFKHASYADFRDLILRVSPTDLGMMWYRGMVSLIGSLRDQGQHVAASYLARTITQ